VERSWAGEPYAQLNVTPTAQPFWRNGKPMDACRFSRFGLTSRLLTAALGEALLTWFREAFLVKTSALQAPATVSTVNAPASGVRWLASFARWHPATSGWKTAQCSLLEESTEFSLTWPISGTMLNGECWERPTLERPICDDASGFLPTPVTLDTGSRFNRSQSDGARVRPTLGAMARFNLWPTPTASDGRSSGSRNTASSSAHFGISLTDAVRGDLGCGRIFPTPTVAMRKGSSIGALTRKDGRSRANDRLDYRVEGSGLTGRLNPTWVEWLMGWPLGWTALEPLPTSSFREWLQQHGDSGAAARARQND
jgi:hypothetical protein